MKTMTKEKLQNISGNQICDFIRERLSFVKYIPYLENQIRRTEFNDLREEHRRFDMSGYESKTGDCTLQNMSILNEFADMVIYDYTKYLFLDFYKGGGELYYQYWEDRVNLQMGYAGEGTVDIIYDIFQKTIFSGKCTRRRI